MWLNVDLGELPGEPEELYAAAHVANVACGGHAGDERSMREAVERCRRHGTALGVHPSYPDREGFGRRELSLGPRAIGEAVAAQCGALAAVARAAGVPVGFIKAHGALYHGADRDPALADAVARGAIEGLKMVPEFVVGGLGGSRTPPKTRVMLTMIGPAGGALARAAAAAGMAYAREAFADRGVRPDGTLVPRGEPGALLTDPAQVGARARELCARGDVETVCVHGDSPGAVALAQAARAALDGARLP
jgi:UPF0271 protein